MKLASSGFFHFPLDGMTVHQVVDPSIKFTGINSDGERHYESRVSRPRTKRSVLDKVIDTQCIFNFPNAQSIFFEKPLAYSLADVVRYTIYIYLSHAYVLIMYAIEVCLWENVILEPTMTEQHYCIQSCLVDIIPASHSDQSKHWLEFFQYLQLRDRP